MSQPFLLAQISDLHLGAPGVDGAGGADAPGARVPGVDGGPGDVGAPAAGGVGTDAAASLEAVLGALARLPTAPDAVLVTGDVADHAAPAGYRLARELLGRLSVPVHVLPGNHDDRAALRAAFALPGAADAPVDYAVDLGPLALIVVDSTVPGRDPGGFAPEQLERLDRALAAAPAKPALLAMHHPPLSTAIPDWDRVNLSPRERQALAAVIARHPQVKAVVGGHLHRVATAALAGRPVLAAPSTYLQARPDFDAEAVAMYGGAPGFALHALRGEELSTQVEVLAAP